MITLVVRLGFVFVRMFGLVAVLMPVVDLMRRVCRM